MSITSRFKEFLILTVKIVKTIAVRAHHHRISSKSAEISFYAIFSLFPIIISFIAFLSIFLRDPNFYLNLTSSLYSSLPKEVYDFLNYNLRNLSLSTVTGSALIIGSVVAIMTSSNLLISVIRSIDKIYQVTETRSYFALRRLSISLTFSLLTLLITAFTLIVFGENFVPWFIGISSHVFSTDKSIVLTVIRWTFISLILFLVSSFLYYKAPNIKHLFRQTIPGAIFFSIAWSFSTYIFGSYLKLFPVYNATYGTLSVMIVLLLWFYITAYTLLLGAIFNKELMPQSKKSMTKKLSEMLIKLTI